MQIKTENRYVRHCALWHGACGVIRTKVLFSNDKGTTRGYWMTRETYNAIPLGEEATPEDFAKHGELVPCMNTDIYSLEIE